MENKILQEIYSIAKELNKSNDTFTRADLAYELKKLGIEKDSFRINELVWKAYCKFNNSKEIKNAFTSNDKTRHLVDEYKIRFLIETDTDNAIKQINKNLKETKSSLEQLDDSLAISLIDATIKGTTTVANVIQGTHGINKIKEESQLIFEKYTTLINDYETAKGDVKMVVSDFTDLRDFINEIFRKYSLMLVDIFGDSIKIIAPELFDFNSIEWLDVQEMLKLIELQYQTIFRNCSSLISEISENFNTTLQNSSQTYKNLEDKRVGVALAVFALAEHYMDAAGQTAMMQKDLLTLKNSIHKDVATIKADMARLSVIYKNINDIFIPKANAFYKYSEQILSEDLQKLLNTLYSDHKINNLKEQRDEYLARLKSIEKEISDNQINIDYYKNHSHDCRILLNSLTHDYNNAKQSKPNKPLFLLNILTLGQTNRTYNRNITEWMQVQYPIVQKYEELNVDLELDQEEYNSLIKSNNENIKEYKALKNKVNSISDKIKQQIKVSDEIKIQALKYVESLILMLKVGKDIINSKLDNKLINAVSTTKFKQLELSTETKNSIVKFTDKIKENLNIDNETAKISLDTISKKLDINLDTPYDDEDLTLISNRQKEVISKGLDLVQILVDLQVAKENNSKSQKHYEEELKHIQNTFKRDLNDIDNKSDVLNEILKKINLSQNSEELKNALFLLADIENEKISQEDWENFLNGTKQINL